MKSRKILGLAFVIITSVVAFGFKSQACWDTPGVCCQGNGICIMDECVFPSSFYWTSETCDDLPKPGGLE